MILRGERDRRIVALAVPALGTLAVEPLYVLVDTVIVGRLGTTPLAGLALAVTVLLLVTAGCNFLAYGTTQRLAHHLGAGDRAGAAGVGVQALWLTLVLGVPLAIGIGLLAGPAAQALGGSGDVLDAATTYLRISAVGIPFILLALVGQGVLRGVPDLRTALAIVVVANLANLGLEIVAVYVLDLGIAGSAWSTVLVQACAAVAYLAVLRPHLRPAVSRRPNRAEMSPLLTAGRHLLLRVGALLAVTVGATAVAARVDDATLAAHQIAATLMSLLALALDALAIPAQSMVAGALGAGVVADAADVGGRVQRLSLWAGGGLAVVLALLAWPLAHVFTADPAVASRAVVAVLVLAAMQPFAGIAMGLDGVLIGAGDYRFLGWSSVAYLAAFVPIAVLTLVDPSLGILGVWLAIAAWMVARAAGNHHRFTSGHWLRAAGAAAPAAPAA